MSELDEQAEQETQSEHLRMVEAILFAAREPLTLEDIASRLPQGADVAGLVKRLAGLYENRGIVLAEVAGRFQFRTAGDLAYLMRHDVDEPKRLSRAAVETLAIIAYHQPVTRGEIEDIRGVGLSRGTLDVLLEAGWVQPRGRKQTPGRPLMYGTTDDFLVHFGLESRDDLPGLSDLKALGLLDSVDDAMTAFYTDRTAGETTSASHDPRQGDLEDAIRQAEARQVEEEDPS